MVGVLTVTLASTLYPPDATEAEQTVATAVDQGPRIRTLTDQHMARLGGQLFSRHLVAVEVAGTLLLVALVAAVAIVAQTKQLAPRSAAREAVRE
jgi:NADH:ubiquinone oxidoreductase subunit 6 (subunit J)